MVGTRALTNAFVMLDFRDTIVCTDGIWKVGGDFAGQDFVEWGGHFD